MATQFFLILYFRTWLVYFIKKELWKRVVFDFHLSIASSSTHWLRHAFSLPLWNVCSPLPVTRESRSFLSRKGASLLMRQWIPQGPTLRTGPWKPRRLGSAIRPFTKPIKLTKLLQVLVLFPNYVFRRKISRSSFAALLMPTALGSIKIFAKDIKKVKRVKCVRIPLA